MCGEGSRRLGFGYFGGQKGQWQGLLGLGLGVKEAVTKVS